MNLRMPESCVLQASQTFGSAICHTLPPQFEVNGAVYASCDFDWRQFQPVDFKRVDVVPPQTIQRSVAKRQAEFLAGRFCAREALYTLCRCRSTPTMNGDRSPCWPEGITGSITHSDGWAAAIVSHTHHWQGLGLDVETRLDAASARSLAREILTKNEQQRIQPENEAVQITLTFSLKESLFKALYPLVKRHFYFEDAEVTHWHSNGTARLRLLKDLSPEWRRGTELTGQYCLHQGRVLSLVAIPLAP